MGESYRGLIAYAESDALRARDLRCNPNISKEQLYGLVNQLRRAAVSVPSNIEEGQAQFSPREFCHFLRHARGSPKLRHKFLQTKTLAIYPPRAATHCSKMQQNRGEFSTV